MPADRGASRARALVASFLQAYLPPHLVELREAWELEEEEDLETPALFLSREPDVLDRYPTVAVSSTRRLRTQRVEVLDGGVIEYLVTYSMRVHLWVRAQERGPTIQRRDDLAAAISLLLLDRQTLRVAGDVALVDEDSLYEEYSEVAHVNGDRFVAGAFVGFDLRLTELVQRSPSGTVATTELEESLLEHPALS